MEYKFTVKGIVKAGLSPILYLVTHIFPIWRKSPVQLKVDTHCLLEFNVYPDLQELHPLFVQVAQFAHLLEHLLQLEEPAAL